MLYLHGARVCTPGGIVENGAVLIDGARILGAGRAGEIACPPDADRRDLGAGDAILAPGFIDLQCNGAFGADFTADPASIWVVAARLPRYGVTTFLPTIVSSPAQVVVGAQRVVTRRPGRFACADPLGLHVEGPFLNPLKRGAHNPAHLRPPSLAAIAGWSPESGVRLVTLAPELPGALDVIRELAGRGVVVSAGHSLATYDQALAGFDAGIRYGTHLFNAMPPLAHRDPGLVGALLADRRAVAGLIADGVHTHPALIRIASEALGSRLSLVTDALAALGMPPGKHRLGDFAVSVDGHSARLADGRLAGSILSLDQAVRNAVAIGGRGIADAIAAVTSTPADLLGIGADRGRIAAGRRADLVLLSADLHVRTTWVAGEIVYAAEP